MNILASFIIPVYNVEPEYITECLQSLTDINSKEVEFLVVDDGSSNGCEMICDQFAVNDARIQVFHKKNSGVSSARNFGLDKSNGKYITFIDADDWIEPRKMENVLNILRINDYDLLAFGQYINFPNESVEVAPFNCTRIFSKPNEISNIQKMVFVRGYGTTKSEIGSGVFCNTVDKFVKKSIIISNGIRFENSIKISEDNLFFFDVIEHCNYLIYVNSLIYHYRMRATSASHNSVTPGLNSIVVFAKYAESRLRELNKPKDYYESLYNRCYDLIFEHLRDGYFFQDRYPLKEKIRLFKNEMQSYPFNKAIKTEKLTNFKYRRQKIYLILLKLGLYNTFYRFAYRKEVLQNPDLQRNGYY